jgi:anti-anti-sigma factor
MDIWTAQVLKERLKGVVAEGRRRLVVDLSDVSFIDSAGLGALISGLKAARGAGGYLRVACPTDQTRLVLELTTLHRVLPPYATIEEALAAA